MGLRNKERDCKIDILRFIAIIGIILAHTDAPLKVNMIRSFDVPLMVMLTGMSFYLSNTTGEIDYTAYITKRFKRLIAPTWIFLTIFFLLFYVISIVVNTNFQFSIRSIMSSYCLIGGIGYVWIIRVYFLTAMLNPVILYISNRIKRTEVFLIGLLLIYVVYSGLIEINSNLNGLVHLGLENIILYTIGWGIISSIGIRLKVMNKKEINMLIFVFGVIFVFLLFKNNFDSVNNYKYPPTLYYISYGVTVSLILLRLLDNKYILAALSNRFIKFISVNSMWLYFWHIVFIFILQLYGNAFPLANKNFFTRFIFLFGGGLLMTVLQERIQGKIKVWICKQDK